MIHEKGKLGSKKRKPILVHEYDFAVRVLEHLFDATREISLGFERRQEVGKDPRKRFGFGSGFFSITKSGKPHKKKELGKVQGT